MCDGAGVDNEVVPNDVVVARLLDMSFRYLSLLVDLDPCRKYLVTVSCQGFLKSSLLLKLLPRFDTF